jgi:tetratricopeptide (TPR) repeat protein
MKLPPLRFLLLASVCWAGAVLGAPDRGELDFLEQRVRSDELDFIAWNKLGAKCLQFHRFTGYDGWLTKARAAADASLKAFRGEQNPGGLSLRARVELASHQFAAALATAKTCAAVPSARTAGLLLQSDAAFELGRYEDAQRLLGQVIEQAGETDVAILSRLAKLDLIHGQLDAAAQHLQQARAAAAEQDPTGDTLAWCLVQIGELAFRQGKWDDAERAYRAASEALPGWYVVADHQAELLGARGQFDEAIAAYEKLVARVPRPELHQALGDLLAFAGKADAAQPWFEKARTAYEKSFAEGSFMYLHHGSGFFADSIGDFAKAVAWARRDLEQRQTPQAYDALAWALFRAGEPMEALEPIRQALATGLRDPHVLYHASLVQISAGHLGEGKKALQSAVALNPRYNSFHVHR